MSDEEDIRSEEEEEAEEEEDAAPTPVHREDTGPTEAQVAMQQRRQVTTSSSGLDDESKEMLELNKEERGRMEEEIDELRARSERRKAERAEEEKLLVIRRKQEDANRKADEEERRKKKDDEERSKREARAAKMMEFEKWKNPPIPNFVISKKERTDAGDEDDEEEVDPEKERKSKEQLEAEKRAILSQRITKLDTSGFDNNKLAEKAKELHNQLYRLESEKYDLEKRFKCQQYDMMELAERARQMNKVGKQGSIKRIQLQEDESDKIQDRFAGCPSRIIMYSEYERQKDKRMYDDRRGLYTGPLYGCPADRIRPQRVVKWNEEGLPLYEDDVNAEEGVAPQAEVVAE